MWGGMENTVQCDCSFDEYPGLVQVSFDGAVERMDALLAERDGDRKVPGTAWDRDFCAALLLAALGEDT